MNLGLGEGGVQGQNAEKPQGKGRQIQAGLGAGTGRGASLQVRRGHQSAEARANPTMPAWLPVWFANRSSAALSQSLLFHGLEFLYPSQG